MTKPLLMFDLDGTLIDSVPDIADAVNRTLSDLQRPTFDETTIRHWVGNGAKILIERALTATQDTALQADTLQTALQHFFDHYAKQTCQKTTAYQGVNEGLHQLAQASFSMAIITNKPIQFVPSILQTLGWQDLFCHILGGDSLAVKKPDSTPLLYTCEKLQFHPNNSYMIGDSKNDVLAGKNAHIKTLALSYGYNYGQDIRAFSPDQTFDNFSDLTTFLLQQHSPIS